MTSIWHFTIVSRHSCHKLLFCWSSTNCFNVAGSTGIYKYSTPSAPCNQWQRTNYKTINNNFILFYNCQFWIIKPLHSYMSINILHTNLFTFPVVLRKITWLTIRSWKWQSFPLFLWPTYFIQGWYYKEKLEDSHSEGFKGWLAWFFTKNKACETVIWTDFLHMMLYNNSWKYKNVQCSAWFQQNDNCV